MNDAPDPRIWPEHDELDETTPEWGLRHVYSKRAGGDYSVSVQTGIDLQGVDDAVRRRLTTLLVDRRTPSDPWPEVTSELIAQAKGSRPLPVQERAERLLRFLAEHTPALGESVHLFDHSDIQLQACAHAEAEVREVSFLANYLKRADLLAEASLQSVTVTLAGHAAIEDMLRQPDSQQAFVALWFGDPMKQPYDDAIKPAICGAGFKPFRIDRKPDVDKIDDEIIGEIRRSRFLIADFTPNAEGVLRGGVYFEAGFARGLGLPVISTCRKDAMKDLHFDTRQYYHIEWEAHDLEAFEQALKQRILAVVGEGAGATPATQ